MILTRTVIYRGQVIDIEDVKRGSQIPIQVQCPMCGSIRDTTYKQITKNGHEYCAKCSAILKRSKNINIGEKFGRWTVIDDNIMESGFSTCICECGTIRMVDNNTLRSGKSRSCGCLSAEINISKRKFLKIGMAYGRLTVIEHSENSGYSVCLCECGNTAEINNFNLNSGRTQSCGCLQKENSGKALRKIAILFKGEAHHNWKGGISGQRTSFMQTIEYKNWRMAVFTRDNYTCKHCMKQSNDLCVHHILNYAQYPALRTDESNGIVFCKQCHIEFHKIYGRKNNNMSQINDFLMTSEIGE